MFNSFSRPYVPGFRLGTQHEVPGFDIDETGLPRGEESWFYRMLPGTATLGYPRGAQTPSAEHDQLSNARS